MLKNLNCSSILINSDNLLIFKLRNSKFDLKDNFVNNYNKTRMLANLGGQIVLLQ